MVELPLWSSMDGGSPLGDKAAKECTPNVKGEGRGCAHDQRTPVNGPRHGLRAKSRAEAMPPSLSGSRRAVGLLSAFGP